MVSAVFFLLAVLCFVSLSVIFFKSYSDPRWRVFDFNSKAAALSELYQVADEPVIKSIKKHSRRTLRFVFDCDEIKLSEKSKDICRTKGNVLDVAMPDANGSEDIFFSTVKNGTEKPQTVNVYFCPSRVYEQCKLAWPDNYAVMRTTVPFAFGRRHSVEQWTGIAENDPDLETARQIMQQKNLDLENKNTVEKTQAVLSFIMLEMGQQSWGTPSSLMQNSSPLEVYRRFVGGEDKGWCEERALVYYLFANAAGIPTRLIDLAGKFDDVKLAGHYFCESYDGQRGRWFMVDPQGRNGGVCRNGKMLDTLEVKRLIDLGVYDSAVVRRFNFENGKIEDEDAEKFFKSSINYYGGATVIGYKFSYPKNKGYSRLKHFLFHPTLLYAEFKIPVFRYRLKQISLYGSLFFLLLGLGSLLFSK